MVCANIMYEIVNVIIMCGIIKFHMCTYKRPSTANVLFEYCNYIL